jgi:hypothetical protein
MWANLPNELIKEVMTYWSPHLAHTSKMYRKLKKIKTSLQTIHKFDGDLYGKRFSTKAIKKYVSFYNLYYNDEPTIRFTKKNMIVNYENILWNENLAGICVVEQYGITKLYKDHSNLKKYKQQKTRIMRFILGEFKNILLNLIDDWIWKNGKHWGNDFDVHIRHSDGRREYLGKFRTASERRQAFENEQSDDSDSE